MVSRAALTSLALLLAVASAIAQYRPSYAANGFQYPRPFIGGDTNTNEEDLGNRFGNNANTVPSKDVLGFDTAVVDQANNYPQEHKPFWVLNRPHIMTHLGLTPESGRGQTAQPTPSAVTASRPVRPAQAARPARVRPSQLDEPQEPRRPARPEQPQEPTIFELAQGAQNNGPSPSTP